MSTCRHTTNTLVMCRGKTLYVDKKSAISPGRGPQHLMDPPTWSFVCLYYIRLFNRCIEEEDQKPPRSQVDAEIRSKQHSTLEPRLTPPASTFQNNWAAYRLRRRPHSCNSRETESQLKTADQRISESLGSDDICWGSALLLECQKYFLSFLSVCDCMNGKLSQTLKRVDAFSLTLGPTRSAEHLISTHEVLLLLDCGQLAVTFDPWQRHRAALSHPNHKAALLAIHATATLLLQTTSLHFPTQTLS